MGIENQNYSQSSKMAWTRVRPEIRHPKCGISLFSDNAQYYQPEQNGTYGAQYGAPQYSRHEPKYVPQPYDLDIY